MGVCDVWETSCLRKAKGQTGLFPDPDYESSKENLLSQWICQPKRSLQRLPSQGGLWGLDVEAAHQNL